jgi:hypothetical protein
LLETHVNKTFFNAIATVAIGTATAQPALAQDQPVTAAPISIAACAVVPTYESVLTSESGVPTAPTGASVWVSFLNRSARTITEVTFDFADANGSVSIADRGRFSSGVTIEHALGPFTGLRGDETTCAVSSVRFDDGTVWQPT